MAYVKIIFQNSPSTATPMNAQNLNHMDDQIALNDQRLTEIETSYVKSFKGRTEDVVPEKGDYDISQIDAADGQNGYVPVWRNSGTEQSPDWGFNMEPQSGSGTGGHTIVDQDGTSMATENGLQFADSFVSDDSVNGITVVENIKEHTTASDYENATEDGIHVIDDGNDVPIGASSEDKVEVTGDGVKTWSQLINDLYALVDSDKLTDYSLIEYNTGTFIYYYPISYKTTGQYDFTMTHLSWDGKYAFNKISVKSSASIFVQNVNGTITDVSSSLSTNGVKLTLYYGTSSTVINLKTSADYCMMSDGVTSVESALTKYSDIIVTPDTSKITALSADFWAKRDSRMVELSIGFTAGVSLTANNWEVIGSIPTANVPKSNIYFTGWDATNNSAVWFSIGTNGNIAIHSPIGGHIYFGFVSYLADTFV